MIRIKRFWAETISPGEDMIKVNPYPCPNPYSTEPVPDVTRVRRNPYPAESVFDGTRTRRKSYPTEPVPDVIRIRRNPCSTKPVLDVNRRIEWARVKIKSCLLNLISQRYRLFLCWLIVYFRISQRYSFDCVFNMFNCVSLHLNFLWYLHADIIEKLKIDAFQWCNNCVNRKSIMCTIFTIKIFTFAKLSRSQI